MVTGSDAFIGLVAVLVAVAPVHLRSGILRLPSASCNTTRRHLCKNSHRAGKLSTVQRFFAVSLESR